MTNSEAVEYFYNKMSSGSIQNDYQQEVFEQSINALEKNDKLKAENERLASDNSWLVLMKAEKEFENVDLLEERDKLKAEIEQLKSELEQSVKLPCKVGQIVYEIKSKLTKCTEHDCEFDDYSCQGCECLECDSKKEYYIRDIKFYSAENILVFERHFGKTIFLTREEAEQSLKGQV